MQKSCQDIETEASLHWVVFRIRGIMRLLFFNLTIFFTILSICNVEKSEGFKLLGSDLFTGAEIKISDATKKAYALVFLSAKCPCSDSHISELKKLRKKFTDIQFVAVHSNTDETESETKAYFKKIALSFPVLQDNHAKIANKFKAYKTPHVFVLDHNEKILYQGGVSSSSQFARAEHKYLRQALEQIEAGKRIRNPRTRTLGCVISRGGSNVW